MFNGSQMSVYLLRFIIIIYFWYRGIKKLCCCLISFIGIRLTIGFMKINLKFKHFWKIGKLRYKQILWSIFKENVFGHDSPSRKHNFHRNVTDHVCSLWSQWCLPLAERYVISWSKDKHVWKVEKVASWNNLKLLIAGRNGNCQYIAWQKGNYNKISLHFPKTEIILTKMIIKMEPNYIQSHISVSFHSVREIFL